MRWSGPTPPNPLHGLKGPASTPSIPDRILPPDPPLPPPERPTIPPPNCGTLPPKLPSLGDLLGGLGRIGRF